LTNNGFQAYMAEISVIKISYGHVLPATGMFHGKYLRST